MNNEKITLAIDFDGTITTIGAEDIYPKIGKIQSDVKKYMNILYDEGYFIIINTCRTGDTQKEARDFLNKNGIKYHLINENDPERIEKYGTDTRKMSADIYIDDKNLGGIGEWKDTYELIHKHEV